jgi:hypothetical protein
MEAVRLKTTLEVEKIVQKASMKTRKIMMQYLRQLNEHFKDNLQTLADTTKGEVYFILEQNMECPIYHTPTAYICKPEDKTKAAETVDELKRYGVKVNILPFKPHFKRRAIHYKPQNTVGEGGEIR